jgi:hypothetical protein
MNDRDRLKQLDVLIDRLERMPASPDRDWMMAEVRARKVDVETGAQPGPVRPRYDEAPLPIPTPPAVPVRPVRDTVVARPAVIMRPVAVAPPSPQPPPRPAAPAPAAPAARGEATPAGDRINLLELGGVLCLGDLPAEPPADGGRRMASPPWARGLRG